MATPSRISAILKLIGLVPVKKGGTGADLSGTGGPGQVVQQPTLGGPFTVGPISGVTDPSRSRWGGWR